MFDLCSRARSCSWFPEAHLKIESNLRSPAMISSCWEAGIRMAGRKLIDRTHPAVYSRRRFLSRGQHKSNSATINTNGKLWDRVATEVDCDIDWGHFYESDQWAVIVVKTEHSQWVNYGRNNNLSNGQWSLQFRQQFSLFSKWCNVFFRVKLIERSELAISQLINSR